MSMSMFTGKRQGALYMSSQVVIRKRVPLLQLQNENAAGVYDRSKYDMSMNFFLLNRNVYDYTCHNVTSVILSVILNSTLQSVEWSHVWVFYLN